MEDDPRDSQHLDPQGNARGSQKKVKEKEMNNTKQEELVEELVKDLKNIHDPEIEINIYDLGLIYDIVPTENDGCDVTMTLTSAFCPVADALVDEVRCATKKHYAGTVNINLTFEPQWSMANLSDEARLTLGY